MWVTTYANAVKLGLVRNKRPLDEKSYYEKLKFDDYTVLSFEIDNNIHTKFDYQKFLYESLFTLGYFSTIYIEIILFLEINRKEQLNKLINLFSNIESYFSYAIPLEDVKNRNFLKLKICGDKCSLELKCDSEYIFDAKLKKILVSCLSESLVEKLGENGSKIEFGRDKFDNILNNSWLFDNHNVKKLGMLNILESETDRDWSCFEEYRNYIYPAFEFILPMVDLSSFEYIYINLSYHTPPHMIEKRVTPEEFQANIEGKKIRKKAPKFSRRSLGYLDDDDADAWRLGVASCMGKDYVFIDHKHAIEESDIPDRIEESIDKWTYTKDLKSFFKKEF